MEVEICVGSSCHLKGSYEVVKEMENYIEKNDLSDEIRLRGSFCLGHCTEGVSVRMDGQVLSLSPENAVEMLKRHWEEIRSAAD
ncbi:(2Fe-2S) ferredoxin domain-containing protein [Proteiniclasticum sp. C24MP]|uniref:(2Fe-2S) ferredoxin domain-containing protein n=1 Tax=Proteiniclasticum sp. C24MP TaxID=3374101 RepID=UPI0037550374